jgi:endoglucanase
MKSLIKKLVEIPAPSGFENQIRQLIREEIESLGVETRIDALGNLIVNRVKAHPKGKKIMLVAHMDEIGVIATHVDENGFVRFTTLGGVKPVNCGGGRVRFLNGIVGVIGSERTATNHEIPEIEQMFIDVGATNPKNCPVKLGDVAAFERPFTDLGERLVSKAMDDRVGVAILIETIRQLDKSPHQVIFVFSVQEEIGWRGATTASFGVEPDLGLAVDVTRTGDTPKGLRMDVSLGKGPAIKIRDSNMISDPRVVDWMIQTAEGADIPYQREILEIGSTDARAIQLSREGVPAGCLSIPCRYIHSPSEMVDIRDIQNGVHLLIELLNGVVELKNE